MDFEIFTIVPRECWFTQVRDHLQADMGDFIYNPWGWAAHLVKYKRNICGQWSGAAELIRIPRYETMNDPHQLSNRVNQGDDIHSQQKSAIKIISSHMSKNYEHASDTPIISISLAGTH